MTLAAATAADDVTGDAAAAAAAVVVVGLGVGGGGGMTEDGAEEEDDDDEGDGPAAKHSPHMVTLQGLHPQNCALLAMILLQRPQIIRSFGVA
jgi:hypothetical protein